MEITLTTPAILFPAVSLLMLAYTNRFLAIASIIRVLHSRYKAEGSVVVRRQIENLRARLGLIRKMQTFGILSLFACILSVIVLFLGQLILGKILLWPQPRTDAYLPALLPDGNTPVWPSLGDRDGGYGEVRVCC
ncbi:MAG: DUF2721 domain-containing protein [Coraliomargaritaceae bacterium]